MASIRTGSTEQKAQPIGEKAENQAEHVLFPGLPHEAAQWVLDGEMQPFRRFAESGGLESASADTIQRLFLQGALQNQPWLLEFLLPKMGDLNASGQGFSALMAAAESDSAEALEFLVKHTNPRAETRTGRSALMNAVFKGHFRCVEILAPLSDPSAFDDDGFTALMMATESEDARCVEPLIPFSEIDAQTPDGETALMMVAQTGFEAGARLLAPISNTALKDQYGYTALIHATRRRKDLAMKILAPLSPVNATDNFHSTALHEAASQPAPDCMHILLPFADANIQDYRGRTPLMVAIANFRLAQTQFLAPLTNMELANNEGLNVFGVALQTMKKAVDDASYLTSRGWQCLDLLAPFVSEEDLEKTQELDIQWNLTPRLKARLEAAQLHAEMQGLQKTQSSGVGEVEERPARDLACERDESANRFSKKRL